MRLSPGTSLSRYEVLSQLGAGGMGEVYLAEDTKLDRQVALKILPETFAQDGERMSRFIREAKSASALNHPNIITIHEISETDGTHFIATEYIEGETLHTRLKGQSVSLKAALEIALQVASALDAAHRAGIVHRDIKPENVMIRPDGLVKILDFGIAKLSEPPAVAGGSNANDSEAATAIKPEGTSPGMIIGTANYMSPEQARGKTIDARSDIFSFGIVLYEMLTGKRAFAGENALDVLSSILKDEPKPIHQLLPEAPHEIERIINKALRKDRDERYQTAKDLLLDLKEAKQELEFQDKLERTTPPHREEAKTQLMSAVITAAPPPPTSSAEYLVSQISNHKLGVALGSIILLALVGFGYWFFFNRSTGPTDAIDSVAVLPFQNRSSDADTEYLSDGLAESLIYRLSQLPNLKVSPTSSVFRYKGKETDAIKIGNELGVQAVMSGRMVQRGENLTISVELVDVRNNKLIWGEQYDRKMSELLATQREIAAEITNKLQLKLSGEDTKGLTKRYTNSNEAYQLYLKGNFYRTKLTEEGYKKGLEYYRQAIEIDPNYALAYTGIAYAYLTAADWHLPPHEQNPKAKTAALKALELDNTLAEGYILLGVISFWYEWDWAACERELKRAIELEPNNAEAHHQYGWYLATVGGRIDQAITEMELAQRLAPLDLQLNSDVASVYNFAGRFDQAIEQARKTVEMDQNYWFSHLSLGLAYERKGQFAEAIAEIEKAHSLDDNPGVAGYLGYVYAAAGKKAEAQTRLYPIKPREQGRTINDPVPCREFAHTPPLEQSSLNTETAINAA